VTSRQLQTRTRTFAIDILRFVDTLPRNTAGRIIGWQLGRSGTSVAANYRRTCIAQSRRDFLAKLKVVEEESDECELWLDLVLALQLGRQPEASRLHKESLEIRAMVVASLRTLRHNQVR
jgi:four helix bundle protein